MSFRARWRVLLPLLALATACGDNSEEGGSPLTAGDSLDGSGSGNDEASTGDSGPALDMPADEGLPTATDEGQNADECTNVDILFVIDNSASMADQQDSLIASFGGFVAGIEANLAFAESVHVGVVSSDNYYANGDGCTGLGDLVTQTGGLESSMCVGTPFTSGKRYMDETEIDLTAKFKCVAELGIGGSDDEKVAGAVLGALAPANNDPGA
ncbi:MAG: hypothetical protein KC457_16960, partial [Myxococcales bacterium]|nr:hypothetical protein [Myxococcales bacterium]